MNVSFADGGSSSGKPSVAELASFASRAGEIDIGGGGDMVELGDDLGMSLLANPNKVAASPKGFAGAGAGAGAGAASGRQVSFGGGGGGGGAGEIPTIQIKPVDDLDVVDLNAAPGASDIHINRPPADPAPFVIGGSDAIPLEEVGGAAPGRLSAEEEQREKQRLLTKLRRLDNDGIGGQRMTMQNSLDELKQEHDSRTDSKNLEASVRFQRNALMTFVSGVEMVNDKFGHRLPMKPRLKGWSESVHTNISDFDDIFEELYDLYKDKAKVHPLLRLVGTLGVSATMYHITNTMAERSGIPGMADLMADNPELQRQFAAAAAAKMGGLGNFMSAAGGFPQGGAPPAPPAPMGYGVPPPPAAAPPPAAMSGRGPFNGASGAEEAPRARREMRGPSGVDDILKAFEAERMMDSARNAPPISAASASIFTPSGPPPTPPRGIQILREGVGGPSDPMADFMAAAMDDGGSVGSGSTMNTERRRGRPRKAVATPVGATLNLNV